MHKELETPEFREKVKEIVRECLQEWTRYSQEQERMRSPMSIGYGGGGPRGPESLAYDFYNARGTDSRGGNQGGGQGGGGQGGNQGGGGGGQGGQATAHYGYPYYNPYYNPFFGGNGNGR